MTICLLAHSETNRSDNESLVLLRVSPVNKNGNVINFLVLDTFWKSQKLISSKKNQSALIAKISSHKTQKFQPIRKNILPQKFCATRGALYSREKVMWSHFLFNTIEHFHNSHITLCFPPSPKKGIVEIQFLFGNLSTPVLNRQVKLETIDAQNFPEGR